MALSDGDTVPDFEALLCNGETFRSRSLSTALGERGGVLVATGFAFSAIARNWWNRLEKYGWGEFEAVPVFGFSRDGPYAQNAFQRRLDNPPFRFFADVDGEVSDALGVRTDRRHMAGTSTPWRSLFVLDSDREIQFAHVTDEWISSLNTNEAAEAIEKL